MNSLWNIIQTIILSLLILCVIHYLCNYIQENFITKKTKDVYGNQHKKYKEIIDELQKTMENTTNQKQEQQETIDFHSIENELLEFANTQSNIYL
jgi:hypothetical protein